MAKAISFDALVIGAGPGGYVCAIRCAQLGLKTAIVEKNPRLGGTCLNVGCIPSKALLHSTEIYHELLHGAKKHGISAENVSIDISALMKKKDGVVDKLGKGVRMLVEKRGIEILTGTAKLLGDGQVEVSGKEGIQTVAAKEIILATGSKPVELPFMPYDGERIVHSDHGIAFDSVPEKLAVIGGGAIGLELGSVWARLGSKVEVIEFLPEIATGFDPDVAKAARRILGKQGLKFSLSVSYTHLTLPTNREV